MFRHSNFSTKFSLKMCIYFAFFAFCMIVGTNNLEMEQNKIKERTQKHLDDYARRGLRTMCIAKKVFFNIYF